MATNGNTLFFPPDGSFRILQVSDPQDMVWPRRAMLKMLDRAYDTLRPDLVLFTGDNTLGNHLHDIGPFRVGTVNDPSATLEKLRRSLRHILRPVEDRGIPFAMIYGNHDDMNDVSKEAQFALYREYRMCLPMNENDSAVDCDTYSIPIRTRDGALRFNVYMLDSAWNDETGQYWRVKPETVAWYERTAAALKEENGGSPVPSLLFLHVPLPDTKRLLVPAEPNAPGAVRDGDAWYRLDPEKATGILGEAISAGEDPAGLFDAIRRIGDVRAVVSGHDHLNCFDGDADGVRMIQSGAASFRCYGGRARGVRVFDLNANDPARFDTQYYSYWDLCGDGLLSKTRYLWDADEWTAKKYTALGAAALTGAAGAAALAIRKHRR